MLTHLTIKSDNAKTGPIPVSTSSGKTCPSTCPLLNNGCYAQNGPLNWHWGKVTAGIRGLGWKQFLKAIASLPAGQVWRHNQAGDLPGIHTKIDAVKLAQLVDANKGKRGFTFTHKPVIGNASNAKAVKQANAKGFTVNLSANSMTEADALLALKIAPVVVVVDQNAPRVSYTPAGNKVVVCPAQQRDDVTCASCKLCSVQQRAVIGFRAHGTSKNKVSKLVSK